MACVNSHNCVTAETRGLRLIVGRRKLVDGRCQNVTNHTNRGLSLHSSLRGPRGRQTERWQIDTHIHTDRPVWFEISLSNLLSSLFLSHVSSPCVCLPQFEDYVMDICFEVLDNSPAALKNSEMDIKNRSDPVYVGRTITAMVTSLLLSAITISQFRFFLIQMSQTNYPSIQSCTYTCHAMIHSWEDASVTCLLHLPGELQRWQGCVDRSLGGAVHWWSRTVSMDRQRADPPAVEQGREAGQIWPVLGVCCRRLHRLGFQNFSAAWFRSIKVH